MSGTAVIDPVVRAAHDRALAELPADSQHDESGCAVCIAIANEEGNVTGITEDEVARRIAAAVDEATRPLREQLETAQATQSQAEREAELAAVKEPLEAQITTLQGEKDVLTQERDTARQEVADIKAYLTDEKEKIDSAAAIAAVRDERAEKVKEVASFDDDYYTDEKLDTWAGMEQAAFDVLLEQITAAAEATPGRTTTVPKPVITAREQRKPAAPRTSAISAALNDRKSIVNA